MNVKIYYTDLQGKEILYGWVEGYRLGTFQAGKWSDPYFKSFPTLSQALDSFHLFDYIEEGSIKGYRFELVEEFK